MPIAITVDEQTSNKSFPNLKAEAVSVYPIQVTKQISGLHGKAQTVKTTDILTQRNYWEIS